jgi:hypothetical protein
VDGFLQFLLKMYYRILTILPAYTAKNTDGWDIQLSLKSPIVCAVPFYIGWRLGAGLFCSYRSLREGERWNFKDNTLHEGRRAKKTCAKVRL